MLNSRGQALIESVLILPVLILICASILMGFQTFAAKYLGEQWVYEASFCLAQEKALLSCQKELHRRLRQIPFYSYEVKQFHRDKKMILIVMNASTPLLKILEGQRKLKTREQLLLPIKVDDFRRTR